MAVHQSMQYDSNVAELLLLYQKRPTNTLFFFYFKVKKEIY